MAHVAWYNYQTNKGVLTEWFYTKLLQHIGMNNYKFKQAGWYLNFSVWFLKTVNIVWVGGAEKRIINSIFVENKTGYSACLKN